MAGKAGGSVSGNKGNGNKGGSSRSRGAAPGVNLGNPADRSKSKGNVDRSKTGMQKAGGPGTTSGKKTPSPSIMRESTWNNLTGGQKMREHGTTSYTKYKAGKQNNSSSGGGSRSDR